MFIPWLPVLGFLVGREMTHSAFVSWRPMSTEALVRDLHGCRCFWSWQSSFAVYRLWSLLNSCWDTVWGCSWMVMISLKPQHICIIVCFCVLGCNLRICVLGFICFFICRVTYTYLLVYSEIPKPDTGGEFWCAQLNHVLQGLFIYVLWRGRSSVRLPNLPSVVNTIEWIRQVPHNIQLDQPHKTWPLWAVNKGVSKKMSGNKISLQGWWLAFCWTKQTPWDLLSLPWLAVCSCCSATCAFVAGGVWGLARAASRWAYHHGSSTLQNRIGTTRTIYIFKWHDSIWIYIYSQYIYIFLNTLY